jgi:hypothetical protein
MERSGSAEVIVLAVLVPGQKDKTIFVDED